MSQHEPSSANDTVSISIPAHRIDRMLPAPSSPIMPGDHIDIFAQAVGAKDSPRGTHGFGMIIRVRDGLELGTFGYRSNNPETTANRGYFGSLISALAWRQLHAPTNPVSIKTTLDYIYLHFRNGAESWIKTGKNASKKTPENMDLVESAFHIWKAHEPIAELMRVPDYEMKMAKRAKDIATSMRDHGGMSPAIKPGEPEEFYRVEDDMDDLISHAVDRDFRHEQRRGGGF